MTKVQVSPPLLTEHRCFPNISEPERGNLKAGFDQDSPCGREVKSPGFGWVLPSIIITCDSVSFGIKWG